jgi:uncharacterized protein YvpB/LysM repeat protein
MSTDQRATHNQRWVPEGVRQDVTWDERLQRHRESLVPKRYPTWQPDLLPEPPAVQIRVNVEPAFDPVRPGLMRLYAARLAHAESSRKPVREANEGERLLVGERVEDSGPVRTLALIGQTRPLGRSLPAHYRRLHPAQQLRFRRLRLGRMPAGSVAESVDPWAASSGSPSVWHTLRSTLKVDAYHPRLGGSTRLLVASFAALILMLGAATTSFASQFRYEVQPGDSIDSIATEFGVDPESMRAASWLPTGDDLQVGQVLIIPEPGQTPAEAAQMAAANTGTSPWAGGTHVVEWGEFPASIAASYGVSVDELLRLNDIDDPQELIPGSLLVIPASAPGSASGPDAAAVIAANVPVYQQQRNLSCEFAAAHAAAMAFGWAPAESDFIAAIPNSLNPHYGYRGNIDGSWGNTQDYGIYAEPLVPVLNDWGFQAEVMYTMGDTASLTAQLDAGRPVVTWLGFWGDTRERLVDDGTYSVFAGMHVVTVFGYDAEGVWVMDPAQGEQVHYSWDFFVSMWTVVDGMSLAIYPS